MAGSDFNVNGPTPRPRVYRPKPPPGKYAKYGSKAGEDQSGGLAPPFMPGYDSAQQENRAVRQHVENIIRDAKKNGDRDHRRSMDQERQRNADKKVSDRLKAEAQAKRDERNLMTPEAEHQKKQPVHERRMSDDKAVERFGKTDSEGETVTSKLKGDPRHKPIDNSPFFGKTKQEFDDYFDPSGTNPIKRRIDTFKGNQADARGDQIKRREQQGHKAGGGWDEGKPFDPNNPDDRYLQPGQRYKKPAPKPTPEEQAERTREEYPPGSEGPEPGDKHYEPGKHDPPDEPQHYGSHKGPVKEPPKGPPPQKKGPRLEGSPPLKAPPKKPTSTQHPAPPKIPPYPDVQRIPRPPIPPHTGTPKKPGRGTGLHTYARQMSNGY